jgi:hypothetical protein
MEYGINKAIHRSSYDRIFVRRSCTHGQLDYPNIAILLLREFQWIRVPSAFQDQYSQLDIADFNCQHFVQAKGEFKKFTKMKILTFFRSIQ